jgi:hypothetical protein
MRSEKFQTGSKDSSSATAALIETIAMRFICLPNVQALAPLGRGWASKRDGGLKLRQAWPTEQPQRLSSRALFAFLITASKRALMAGKLSRIDAAPCACCVCRVLW